MNIRKLPVFNLVKARLDLWRESSPAVVQLIEEALTKVGYFYAVNSELPKTARFELPVGFERKYPKSLIKPIVSYRSNGGVTLSIPAWSALGDYSQAAVLIKEALREIQIGNKNELTDKNLQDIIATITLGSPDSGSLDNFLFLSSRNVLRIVPEAQILHINKIQFREKLCQRLTEDIHIGRNR